ncbi:MAG: zinc ribbon domain-containing protein [Pelovirga sp.]
MPIFEYQCRQCGRLIEKIQPQSTAEVSCPTCSGPAVRQVSRTASSVVGGQCSPAGSGRFT